MSDLRTLIQTYSDANIALNTAYGKDEALTEALAGQSATVRLEDASSLPPVDIADPLAAKSKALAALRAKLEELGLHDALAKLDAYERVQGNEAGRLWREFGELVQSHLG